MNENNKSFAHYAVKYFTGLTAPKNIPDSIKIMNPYTSDEVRYILHKFYNKYYNDHKKRTYILGINPGRFGGGLTGISFTDPVALNENCGISNSLGSKKELSSEFIYNVINEFGGTHKFFSEFYLSALYPLAITKEGKNYNYYDDPASLAFFLTEISKSITSQTKFGSSDTAICLGVRNYKYLNSINEQLKIFNRILVLDHPRYIMQYKRKKLSEYIAKYLKIFNEIWSM